MVRLIIRSDRFRRILDWSVAVVCTALLICAIPTGATAGSGDNGVYGLVGLTGVGRVNGVGLEFQLAYHWKHAFAGARVLNAAEFMILNWDSAEPRHLLEVGPLVGMRGGWRYLQAEAFVGVSQVNGEWYDDSAYSSRAAFGATYGACVLLTPTESVGIGIDVFGNVNHLASYAGGGVVFTFWK